MERSALERVLAVQQIDAASLSLILSRGDERIYELMVPEAEAITQWQRLRDALAAVGYWPVVGYGAKWLDDEVPQSRARHLDGSTQDILAESAAVDPEEWMVAQEQEWLEITREDAGEFDEPQPADAYEDMMGEWPESAEPYMTFAIPHDAATREPVPRVPIALVPAKASWEIPALLRFDAGMVPTGVHVAMARRWHDLYGAEVVGVLPDLLEMRVLHPPTTLEEALALAKEQFLYCRDVVIQGTQTLQALAAGLLNGMAWYFWWD